MSLARSQPLHGRRIIVTRARHQAGRLSDALRDLGAKVIELPVIEIVPPASYAPLDEACLNMDLYQWLIFTSANAARVVGERLAAKGVAASGLKHARVIAIGPATAAALESQGLAVDVIPDSYVAEGLVKAMMAGHSGSGLAGARVLLARAKVARDVIPDALLDQGAVVDVVDAYETVVPARSIGMLPDVLASMPDAVTFTSSSTVKNFVALLRECGVEVPPTLRTVEYGPTRLRAISIGPVTSESLRQSGWEPFAEAARFDVTGLVDATVHALRHA